MFAIAKIRKTEMDFSSMFGNPTPPITFVTDKIFSSKEDAEQYILEDLQPELNKSASVKFDRGSDVEREEWERHMRSEEKVCMISETYLIVPITGMVELLGRPEFLNK